MDQKLNIKPPSFWARFKGKPRRLVILIAGSLVTIVLFMVVVQFLTRAGENTASTSFASSDPNRSIWDRDRILTQIKDLKYSALMAREEVDKFHFEADIFFKKYDRLLQSTKGESLQPMKEVVDYFFIRWKDKLPKRLMVDLYRDTIDGYVDTAEKVLTGEYGAVSVPQELFDEVDRIGQKAGDCWLLYQCHNKLLDALSRKIGEGPNADPRSIKAEVEKQEDKMMLELVKTLPIKELEDVKPYSLLPLGDHFPRHPRSSSSRQSDRELYHRQGRKRLDEERAREEKDTLMRGSVRP